MLQVEEPTDERVRAIRRALIEHAEMAAMAARRAKTPADRIAHAEVELLLRTAADKHGKEVRL